MIRATFDGARLAAAGPVPGSRTITGVAVPYGVPGTVTDGTVVVFEPGSIDAAARPVALRDHDRTRPIGRVVDAVDRGDHLAATVKVSGHRDGDEALMLAADDVLGAFSVGAEPTDWDYDDAGVLRVRAADWQELSLLTLGAFPTARVATVTASQPGGPPVPNDLELLDVVELSNDPPPDPDPDPDPDEEGDDDADDVEVVETRAVVPVSAGRGRNRARPDLSLRDVARITAGMASGLIQPARGRAVLDAVLVRPSIQAAIQNVTLVGTNNVGAMYRPGYQAELIEIVSMGSPLVDIVRQGDLERGDYPNKTFNVWTQTPQVALQATEKAEINSAPVAIGPASVPVQTWATGNDISQQLLDFGAPSFVEDYIRAAAVDYAEVIDTYAATALLAAATNVATLNGDTFITVVQKLLGALNPTKVPAGGLFLAVAYDVGVGLIGVQQNDGPAFWDGSVSFGTYQPSANMSGMQVIVDPNLPARTYLMGVKSAATWYDLPGTPFSLRAVNVGHLGLDVAVYGYGALGIQYPLAFVKTTQP